MAEAVQIRDAVEADIAAMVALLAALFAIEADFDFDAEKQQRGLMLLLQQGSAVVLVAQGRDGIVGMCTMQRLVSTAEGGWTGLVEDVVVAPSHRRRGIGSKLLAAMQQRARTLDISRLQLLVDRTNAPALDFYGVCGWRSTALRALRRYA